MRHTSHSDSRGSRYASNASSVATRSGYSRRLAASLTAVLLLALVGIIIAYGLRSTTAETSGQPPTPTNLAATEISAASVSLVWSPGGRTPKTRDYLILRDGAFLAKASAAAFTDRAVAAGITYRYQIEAAGAADYRSDPSAPLVVRVPRNLTASSPAVPRDLTARAVSSSHVILAWHLPAAQASGVRFLVYRNGRNIGSSATLRFSDLHARPSTTYSYKVTALGALGARSGPSNVARIVTPAAGDSPRRGSSPTPSSPTPSSPTPSSPTAPPSHGGFPDSENSGYVSAPGYPGHLRNCNNIRIRSNTTYKYCDFPNGIGIGGQDNHPVNVTFIGCRFASNDVGDADVADYATVSSSPTTPSSLIPCQPAPNRRTPMLRQ